jgi:hypothetical protein
VAAVIDGGTIRLYIDGQMTSTSSNGVALDNLFDSRVLIGTNSQHPDRVFGGIIDDVRLYDWPLTANEINILRGGGGDADADADTDTDTDADTDTDEIIGLPYPEQDLYRIKGVMPDPRPSGWSEATIAGYNVGSVSINMTWFTWEPSRKNAPCGGSEQEYDGRCYKIETKTDLRHPLGRSVLGAHRQLLSVQQPDRVLRELLRAREPG